MVSVLPATRAPSSLLEILQRGPLRVREDLVGSRNREGGSGGALGIFAECGGWFLKASRDRRYPDAASAIEREWSDELRRQQLGIYHPQRIWFLTLGADAGFWACSLTPILPIVRARLEESRAGSDREGWDLYLEAFRMTFELARREGLLLDCNPNNFGVGTDRLYYIDDDIASRSGRMPFGHQLLLRLREYEGSDPTARLDFVHAFAALVHEYRDDEPLRTGLRDDLEPRITWPREAELRESLEQLLRSLGPPARSAR